MCQLDDLLTTIRSNIDIVSLIGAEMRLDTYGDVYRGGPPGFFDELPSFIVDPRSQTWRDTHTFRDYSGGFTMGGDCVDFVRRRDGLTYLEALRLLANDLDLDPPWNELSGDLTSWSEHREVEELLTWVALYYHFDLPFRERGELADDLGLAVRTLDRLGIGRSSGHLRNDIAEILGQTAQTNTVPAGLFMVAEDSEVSEVLLDCVTFPCWRHGRAARIVGLDSRRGTDAEGRRYVVTLTKDPGHPDVSERIDVDVLFGEDSVVEGGELVVAPDVVSAAAAMHAGLACVAPLGGRLEPGHHPRLAELSGDQSRLVFFESPGALEAAHAVQVAGGRVGITVLPETSHTNTSTAGGDLQTAIDQAVSLTRYVQRAGAEDGELEDEEEDIQRQPRFKGAVVEQNGRYNAVARNGGLTAISSFVIRPTRRLVIDDDEEIIEGDVVCESGLVLTDCQFPPRAFERRTGLQRILKRPDLQWTGSTDNLQGVMRLLNAIDVPRITGTRNIGYCESLSGPRWVTPRGSLAPLGSEGGDDVVYLESGAVLAERIEFAPVDDETVAEAAEVILPRLLELNTPEVVLPIIGWFFTAPLRPRIQRFIGAFPTLFVWGTHGSGKSSIIIDVFWPMFGVVESSPFSCTDTEAAIIGTLSSTDSVPVFMDEYKPSDIPANKLELLHRYIRRLYKGEAVGRGRQNGSVFSRRLTAPLCLAGETRSNEPAIVERLLTAVLDKNALRGDRQNAFKEIKAARPRLLAASIIRWLLAQDTEADLDLARSDVERLIGARELPPRVMDHLVVLRLGLLHFTWYADAMGVDLPELDLVAVIDAVLDDLLEGDRGVKSGLDFFIEKLSVLASQGKIRRGIEYVFTDDGLLALRLQECHNAYSTNWRPQDGGERLDKKAISRLLRESLASNGYVKNTKVLRTFAKGRQRAVLIDFEKASESLDVDGFDRC